MLRLQCWNLIQVSFSKKILCWKCSMLKRTELNNPFLKSDVILVIYNTCSGQGLANTACSRNRLMPLTRLEENSTYTNESNDTYRTKLGQKFLSYQCFIWSWKALNVRAQDRAWSSSKLYLTPLAPLIFDCFPPWFRLYLISDQVLPSILRQKFSDEVDEIWHRLVVIIILHCLLLVRILQLSIA